MVRVINLRTYVPKENEVLFRIDRQSPVGNPFYMHNESERDRVCEQYKFYFEAIIKAYQENGLNSLVADKKEFILYLARIVNQAKKSNVALGCWCVPKRCHGLTIKKFVEKYV